MACGCTKKPGLGNQLLTAAPRPSGAVVDLSYAPGMRSQALPALSGLGVNAAWHDRDGRIAARKLPSFPVPAAAMARVGWRTPAGSYALPVNGLGALRFMGPGMGRLSAFAAESQLIIPPEGSPAVTRSRGALPDPSEARATWGAVPARVSAVASIQGAIQYARGSFKSAVKQNPAWGEFYRWPHDLAVWLNTRLGRSPAKVDFDHAVGTLKAALARAEDQVRAARAGVVVQVQPTPPRPQPQVQPVSPVVDPVAPPPAPGPAVPDTPVVAQAGMLDFLADNWMLAVGGATVLGGLAWYATKKK